jgi:hypothetical protein
MGNQKVGDERVTIEPINTLLHQARVLLMCTVLGQRVQMPPPLLEVS